MLICLDAGHGGSDSGAVNSMRYEKADNIRFAIAVESELVNQGFKVLQTRTSDKFVSLKERTDLANRQRADLFVSLHRNAFVNSIANGVECWIYNIAPKKTESFANAILSEIVNVGVQTNRGVKRGNYHVVRESIMPACLLELGFLSNNKDNQLFDSNFEKYAAAVAKGICKYMGVEYKQKQSPPDPPTQETEFYRVQLGAFKSKTNAQNLVSELKAKGYNAFIVQTKSNDIS